MIDINFNHDERILNVEPNDVFFYRAKDKVIACRIKRLKLYWPYFDGRMRVSKMEIDFADEILRNYVTIGQLYAHAEDVACGEPYFKGDFVKVSALLEKGYEIPNFIDEKHHAIGYVWDGYRPTGTRLGVCFDVLNKEIEIHSMDVEGKKIYATAEDCAKDNSIKVVLFADQLINK